MVFAFFSLNPMEILILGGMCFTPMLIGVVLLVVLRNAARSSHQPTNRELALEDENRHLRESALEAENARLREELARLKSGPASQDITL